MKRFTALLLSLLLAICMGFPAAAQKTGKISTELQKILETLPEGEKTPVWIWAYSDGYNIHDTAWDLASKELGFDGGSVGTVEQMDLWAKAFNNYVYELESAPTKRVLERLAVLAEDIIYSGYQCAVNIDAAKIAEAAELKEVEYIDRYDTTDPIEDIGIEPIEDWPLPGWSYDSVSHQWIYAGDGSEPSLALIAAIRNRENNPDLPEEEIVVLLDVQYENGVTLARYGLRNYSVPSIINRYEIGDYTLDTPEPELMYFKSDMMCSIKEAYDKGYISDSDLDLMTRTDGIAMVKNDYYAGDADRDGEVTVMDSTRIQRVNADLTAKADISPTAADVDGDGEVTVLDATRIQRTIAGLCDMDGTMIELSPILSS